MLAAWYASSVAWCIEGNRSNPRWQWKQSWRTFLILSHSFDPLVFGIKLTAFLDVDGDIIWLVTSEPEIQVELCPTYTVLIPNEPIVYISDIGRPRWKHQHLWGMTSPLWVHWHPFLDLYKGSFTYGWLGTRGPTFRMVLIGIFAGLICLKSSWNYSSSIWKFCTRYIPQI